ncbi:MAG: Holliday junction branch migration protein RuvA [Chlamydiae bacterium]|nr:Holliday junction branch migration protein RuvA [Chlamydiota bacterium]
MYEHIKGQLILADNSKVVIEANGIGYKIFIPLSSFAKLPNIGSDLLIYVVLIVREDAHTLYGFLSKEEKELFELLINISGIGPKTANNLIGHIDFENFQQAIANNDTRLISKVPGIGKKTSERLVIELKDKFKNFVKISNTSTNTTLFDAINALINLGYNPMQAQKAARLAYEENKETSLSNLITSALRKL